MLRALDAFPPDLIMITHPHWDHAQGIPLLREEASRQGKKIVVLASNDAIPLLKDASFNNIFGDGPYAPIQDVTPVREGERIDLGGISLQIYEIPGHCRGHIAILDEKNSNIFVRDAIGYQISDTIMLPNFMPPTWDPEAFLSSVNKISQIPYASLCLAHFGCIDGNDAKSILKEAVETYQIWWQWYERNAERLSDTDYLLQSMRKEIKLGIPIIKPVSFRLKVLLSLVTAAGTITGKKTAIIDKLALSRFIDWLAKGYRIYRNPAEIETGH
jgi:glyoxylase-like metal-dependent hydrolase (beta-lactamase superfamily II)